MTAFKLTWTETDILLSATFPRSAKRPLLPLRMVLAVLSSGMSASRWKGQSEAQPPAAFGVAVELSPE